MAGPVEGNGQKGLIATGGIAEARRWGQIAYPVLHSPHIPLGHSIPVPVLTDAVPLMADFPQPLLCRTSVAMSFLQHSFDGVVINTVFA